MTPEEMVAELTKAKDERKWSAVNAALIFGALGWVLIGLLAYGLVGAIETGGLW